MTDTIAYIAELIIGTVLIAASPLVAHWHQSAAWVAFSTGVMLCTVKYIVESVADIVVTFRKDPAPPNNQ